MNEREVVKGISHSLRISHEEIAQKVGISQSSLTRMLNGGVSIRTGRLSAICEAIGAELVIRRGNKEWKI